MMGLWVRRPAFEHQRHIQGDRTVPSERLYGLSIGGAPGCGKTTCAHELSCTLKLDHRLSTDFIRQILREQTTAPLSVR